MAQPLDHATYQLYETYHTPVHVMRDMRTYDHFASAYSHTIRQVELLTSYMQEMINALLQDVNEKGDCWLLRSIISHDLPSIHLLDHSAIAYVYTLLLAPEETPTLDTRSIPYSSAFSRSAGGMLYADRHARACVIDQRTDELLHPLCHALLMYAREKALHAECARLEAEKTALNSRITQLNDQILGLERDLGHALRELDLASRNTVACFEASAPAADSSPEAIEEPLPEAKASFIDEALI